MKKHIKTSLIFQLFLMLFILVASVTLKAQTIGVSKELQLDSIFSNPAYQAKLLGDVFPMNNGELYAQLDEDFINIYSFNSAKKIKTLFSLDMLKGDDQKKIKYIMGFQLSRNEKKILISTAIEPIYRYSQKGLYYIWDIASSTLTPLSENGKQMHPSFSPDGTKVAFVRDNNLFVKDLLNGQEIQVTTDGQKNNIINGSGDWVYEEEFELSKAYEWSPDGKQIAFYRFDESGVRQYIMPIYGSLYPEMREYKYPVAGEANSVVSIHIYNVGSKVTTKMDVGDEIDQYIPRIKWTQNPNELIIYRFNRLQNKLELIKCDLLSSSNSVIYAEENKYYININDDLKFLKNGNFILTSEKDGFNHIYLYSKQGAFIQQVTKGSWDVSKIISVDEASKTIFYLSTETSPINNEAYSVRFDGTRKKRLLKEEGVYDLIFSSNHKYFISTYTNANTPYVSTLYTINAKPIKQIIGNQQLVDLMNAHGVVKKEFFSFATTEGITLNGWMIKPPQFSANKKYPVIMYIYGGPGAQTVTNSWDGFFDLWLHMMSQKGFIVVSVDNRGTPGRGEAFAKSTYMQLGNLETQDQIETAKYLCALPYVDRNRIGMFGWSYGGYMATLCLTKGADYFKTGVAVAPATNWKYYDNIYTERYMRRPQDNPTGYNDNIPMLYAKKLKGNLLIIHGSADDNVHLQNSMDLTTALIGAGKPFDMMIYPNKNHSISGKATRTHLFKKITEYFVEKL